MSAPTLFDLEAPAWTVVEDEPFDWAAYEAASADQKKSLWKAYASTWRCGLCGRLASRMPWSRGCGGSTVHRVCDDCATIDGCHPWVHDVDTTVRPWKSHEDGYEFTMLASCSCGWQLIDYGTTEDAWTADTVHDTIAVHISLTEASRWGIPHTPAEHEREVDAQAKRRAAYIREIRS